MLKSNLSTERTALAATPGSAESTATREAEIAELRALQTQVAQPVVCTPAPTETPPPPTATATEVPLAATGVPLTYLDIWTLTLFGIAPTPESDEISPAGQFMRINFEVSHSSRSAQLVRFTDFVLSDSQGRFSRIDRETNRRLVGNSWEYSIPPGVTENRAMVFDVAADAGDSFILESDADPTFRVALTVEQRG
jgi:hypothetical protein